jgi:hypothetical protein
MDAMDLICRTDPRRDAVRRKHGRNGLDYVEVGCDDTATLYIYFLGKLPPELATNKPGIERFLQIDGGERVTGLRILDIDPQVADDPERDDSLVVTLDRRGDFSPYTLRLVGVEGIDPRYDRTLFSFNVCCPADIDCKAPCDCEPPVLDEPQISYLAKDYASFRQLILDRLAVVMPEWTERHVPDIGVTVVELLAYVGDQLSYYQDAVATEAYIGTARQRISVRRHARLVDYLLHEGCNARAWVQVAVSGHLELPSQQIAFITGLNLPQSLRQPVMSVQALDGLLPGSFELFEPLPSTPPHDIVLRPAHNRIAFYTWGRRECCLMPGTTRATLLDQWVFADDAGTNTNPNTDAKANAEADRKPSSKPTRALDIRVGDVLILEEVLGAKTGNPADADPRRRCAVRVTSVQPADDPIYPVEVKHGENGEKTQHMPTPLIDIEWAAEDALPFALCLSALGQTPECTYITDISVARGNIVLVDHGRTVPQSLPPVPGEITASCCECEGEPSDVALRPARYRPTLAQAPLVFSEALAQPPAPASQTLMQDPRAALPALTLVDDAGNAWTPRRDLLASGEDDRDVVVEMDSDGHAHLRFGDDELGRAPTVGSGFAATYRVGGGAIGNVGPESIAVLVLENLSVSGITVTVRNPLPAQGGIDPEPIEEARLLAPAAFRRQIERAITAADYAEIAQRNAALQRAAARLTWTGSWYEADVAVDPLGAESVDDALLSAVMKQLYRYRRMGHDLRVQRAVYVPITLALEVCALPGHERGHVKAALLERFSRRVRHGGQRGFFHPDELSFGDAVFLSRIIAAAQAVAGVECVTVTEFHRAFEPANHEIDNGVLPLASHEIAQLDNDPNHPERGQLRITVRGGR